MLELPIKGTKDTIKIRPTKIIALGLNYKDHIAESPSVKVKSFTPELPTEPVLFPKTVNVLIGPDEPIKIPKIVADYNFKDPRVDHEIELAIIIGKNGKFVSEDKAMEYVAGYTCMNDVSQRNIQNLDRSGWFRGKSFDTFGPIGPCVVRPEDIGDPHNLDLECKVNGEIRQKSNTRYMIFKLPRIISFISRNFTLCKGDIIMTGTPAGVGPLNPGDVVELEIENIGILRNPVEAES